MHKIFKQILFVSLGLIFSITSSSADGTRILKFGKHLDFGTVSVGDNVTRELTLYNKGDSELTVYNLSFHKKIKGLFTGNWSGIIPPNGKQNVTITFTPIRNTRVSGLVYINSDRTNSGDRSRSLTGLGEEEGSENTRILRLGKHLNFSDVVVGSSSVKQLTIYNDGNSVLNIHKIRFHQKLNNVYTASWTGSIPAHGSKTIDITFKPTDTKTYNGLVYIESDKTNKVDRNRLLRGRGIEASENHRPIIHLNGNSIVAVVEGSSYVDEGAVATDFEDGNITANITTNITLTSNANPNLIGEYNLTYTVVDSGGLEVQISRVVRITSYILTKEKPLVPSNCLGKITKSGADINGNGILEENEVTLREEHYDEGTPITREALIEKIRNAEDITNVNTCKITDMSDLFYIPFGHYYDFPELELEEGLFTILNAILASDISGWNTGSVTNMSGMFYNLKDIPAMSLNDWDVSNVTDMSEMFYGLVGTGPRLDRWDVSNVTNMSKMFGRTQNFNQRIDSWDVSNVRDMSDMFHYAQEFNQALNDWNVSNVTNMKWMFYDAISFNQPLDSWDVSNVRDMSDMFHNAYDFNQSLDSWNISDATNVSYMFLKEFPRSLWNSSFWEHPSFWELDEYYMYY